MQNTKIVIMGNGKIGEAILHLLNQASATKHDKCLIDIYDNDPLKNKSGKTLKDCTTNANFVFLCLPSWHTGQALLEIKPFLKKNTIIISVAKGLEAISKNSIDELIEKNLKKLSFIFIWQNHFPTWYPINPNIFSCIIIQFFVIFVEKFCCKDFFITL